MTQGEHITAGAVVQLKSGGPAMTVETDYGDGSVQCTWFEDKKRYSEMFWVRALQPADAPRSMR